MWRVHRVIKKPRGKILIGTNHLGEYHVIDYMSVYLENHRFQGQLGLHREFQASLRYRI